MKRAPAPIKPDIATYNIAKRMEGAGLLTRGTALMLAATAGLAPANAKAKRESDAKLYDKGTFRGTVTAGKRGKRS